MGRPLPAGVENLVRQTHRIWEEKAVGLVYDCYQHNVSVHTALGDRYGRDQAVADTVQQLATFPDLRLHGEGVVWNDGRRLYVSHRATRVAHNTGYGVFGKPTGRRVRYRTITDYLIHENRIVEVWEVHDGLALTRQLGLTPLQAVAAVVRQNSASCLLHGSGDFDRLRGQQPPDAPSQPTTDDGAEAFVRWAWHEIWNRRRLDRISQLCTPNHVFFGPSGSRLCTRDGFAAYVLGLLAAFPDASVQLEHLAVVGSSEDRRVAVRWRLSGTHDGPGLYGTPTGQRVSILGITHHRLQGDAFAEEWTVFDELALLGQLHAGGGANGTPALLPPDAG